MWDEGGTVGPGYARVCEADGIREVENEREDNDWHEATGGG